MDSNSNQIQDDVLQNEDQTTKQNIKVDDSPVEKKILTEEVDETKTEVLNRLNEIFDEYYLSGLQRAAVSKFIRARIGNKDDDKVKRVREWLLYKINKKRYTSVPKMQLGCPDIVPGLRSMPWWDLKEFPWMQKIIDSVDIIRDELLSLRSLKGFQPYRGPSWTSKIPADDGIGHLSHDKGDWNVFYLYLHEIKFDSNCSKVPKTMEIIDSCFHRQYFHAFFSAMNPGTHILKHHGSTNKKLRFHLPLLGVKGSRLRVAHETKEQETGVAYVFDDSFEHEAFHDGDETRLILIVDFWHPDLTDEEIKFLNVLQRAKMRFEKFLSEKDTEKDNFFSIIDQSRDILPNNDWWASNQQNSE